MPDPGPKDMLRCGEILHGHACPPLVLGLRAGFAAMERLEAGRAVDRELFAMVELGSDHYAQGFADGIQLSTGCTFGKDLITRVPLGKYAATVIDQVRGRAVRVGVRPEVLDALESTEWFREVSGGASWATVSRDLVDPAVEFLLHEGAERLLAASPIFPLRLQEPARGFETARCEDCGESVLERYLTEREGRRLCVRCDERRQSLRR
jgi:formylmethanofuran dehydrogenase subunit E